MNTIRSHHALGLFALLVAIMVSPLPAFDIDRDNDIDLHDFAGFNQCAAQHSDITDTCRVFDIDGNESVNLLDFAAFQQCHAGQNTVTDFHCLPLRADIVAPDSLLIGHETDIGALVENNLADPQYEWRVTKGDAEIINPGAATPRVIANNLTTVDLELTVRDTESDWIAVDRTSLGVVTQPLAPTVDIEAIPATTVQAGSTLLLKAHTADPLGIEIVEIVWNLADGPFLPNPFTNPTSVATNFNTCCPGTYQIAATARNALGQVGKTFATINIEPGAPLILVNAGIDRILFPTAADFGGSTPFSAGAVLASGSTNGIVPDISAVVNGLSGTNIVVEWEVVSVPERANAADVLFFSSASTTTTYMISPNLQNVVTTILGVGTSGTFINTIIPGEYIFRITATDLKTGIFVSDEVSHTLLPGFQIPANNSPGSFHGLANAPQNLTNYTTNAFDLPLKVRTLLNATIQYTLRDAFDNTQPSAPLDFDQSGAINAADTAFLYSDFTPIQLLNEFALTITPAGQLADDHAQVSSDTRGTYILQAAYSAGVASVASSPAGGLATFHVQSPMLATFDARSNFASSPFNHFGLVNSTESRSNPAVFSRKTVAHGARAIQNAESWFAATAATCCDINGDGWEELILGINENFDGSAGDLGIAIIRGLGADPAIATNSPLNNSPHNFGRLSNNFDGGDSDDLGDPNGTTLVDVFEVSDNVGANEFISDLACCDLDNDGNLDLVVGEPGFGTNAQAGRVHIYYGTANKGFAQNPWSFSGNTVGGSGGGTVFNPVILQRPSDDPQDFDLFGYRLECCDYNNDGVNDLIVAAPGGGQAVTIARVNGNATVNGSQANVTTVTIDNGLGGNTDISSLTAGDLIRFGADNLFRRVVGSNGTTQIIVDRPVTVTDNVIVEEVNRATGAIYGFAGSIIRLSNTTINDTGTNTGFRLIPTSANSGDFTGAGLSCDDVSGDGVADIIYGAPGRQDSAVTPHQNAGAVLVLNGGQLVGSIATVTRIFEGNAAQLGLGRDVIATDFNGDGTRDIVISALVGDTATGLDVVTKTGRIFFIPSSIGSIDSSQIGVGGQAQLSSQPQITGFNSDANFGVRLCSSDFNNDGFNDVFTMGSSATIANNVGLLINGAATLGATVTAATTINDANAALFRTPSIPALATGYDPDGVLYFSADACIFCDINGDQVTDLFFSGNPNAGSDAYAIYGAAGE